MPVLRGISVQKNEFVTIFKYIPEKKPNSLESSNRWSVPVLDYSVE